MFTKLEILKKISQIEPRTIFVGSVALYLHGLLEDFRDIDISISDTENFNKLFLLRSERLKMDIKNHPGQIKNSHGVKRDSFSMDGYLIDIFIPENQIDFRMNEDGLKFASIEDIYREYNWIKEITTSERLNKRCDYYLSLVNKNQFQVVNH